MLFSLFDTKAEVFGRLFEAENVEVAKRMFVSLILTGDKNNITQYPFDFQLFHVGNYDNSNGNVEGCCPYPIMSGQEAFYSAKRYSEEMMKGVIDESITEESSNGNT